MLRPGGTFVLLWNRPHPELSSPLPEPYRERFGALREQATLPEPAWQNTIARGPFGDLRTAEVDHEQVSSREDVLAFAASQSWIAARPDRATALDDLGALLPEAEYRFPLRAEVYWALRE